MGWVALGGSVKCMTSSLRVHDKFICYIIHSYIVLSEFLFYFRPLVGFYVLYGTVYSCYNILLALDISIAPLKAQVPITFYNNAERRVGCIHVSHRFVHNNDSSHFNINAAPLFSFDTSDESNYIQSRELRLV